MKKNVEEYINKCSILGEIIMSSIACSLGLDESYFIKQFQDPTTLFRIFNYPPHNAQYGDNSYAVGEHCDYGFITILYQDECGGLEVRNLNPNTSTNTRNANNISNDYDNDNEWIQAPFIKDTFIINLGDALEHCTGGLLRATPHRVRQRVDAISDRLSLPFFYDPNFNSQMKSLVSCLSSKDQEVLNNRNNKNKNNDNDTGDQSQYKRWDDTDVTLYRGTYGDYLLSKVAKVFPELALQTEC